MFLVLPNFVMAQTDVGNAVSDSITKIAQDKFLSETGLDQVTEITDLDAGKIADKTVDYVRGDVPSPLMSNLLEQIAPRFQLWTVKTHDDNVPYKATACERAANQRLSGGIFNTQAKAHFSPWVDIGWNAIKGIASGGESIGEMITKNTKSKVEEMIKETLFGKAEPKLEVVTIPHYDSCNSETKVTWDPVNMRIIIVTTGNCQCKLYKEDGRPSAYLKNYSVTVVAPVKVTQVNIEEKNKFIFWKSYNVQAQYKVGKLHVTTEAECNCSQIVDPPPPPPKEPIVRGFFGRIFDWFFGPKDEVDTSDKDTANEEKTDPAGDVSDSNISEEDTVDTQTTEKSEPTEKDAPTEPETNDHDTNNQNQEKTDTQKTFTCGSTATVQGEQVATFPFRQTPDSDVNFSCNNSCSEDQVCKVLPESVTADSESCVYCAPKYTQTEEPKEPEDNTPVTCEIPSKQNWNNTLMPGFTYVVLDKKRVRVENSATYCGMNSLAEFEKAASATMSLFSCPTIKTSDFIYTDARGSCSFVAQFGN